MLDIKGQDAIIGCCPVWSEPLDLRSIQGAIVDEDLVDDPVEEVVHLTTRSPDLDAARADRRRRTGDGKRLDAVEVGPYDRPIERRREMIPDPRIDTRTEASVDDRVSGSVRGFEGDKRVAEVERRVVSHAQADWMLIGVRPVVPIDPEGDRPLPAHGTGRCNFVVDTVELLRVTDLPCDVRRAGDGPIIPMS